MSTVNFKKLTAEKLNRALHALNNQSANGNKLSLLIFTNFGHIEVSNCVDIYEGYGLNHDDLVQGVLYNAITASNDELIHLQGIDKDISADDDTILLLKNAKVTTYGSKTHQHEISDMILFADQIVGLSFR